MKGACQFSGVGIGRWDSSKFQKWAWQLVWLLSYGGSKKKFIFIVVYLTGLHFVFTLMHILLYVVSVHVRYGLQAVFEVPHDFF